MKKKKLMLVGIAGTAVDLLLSVYSLGFFLYHNDRIRNNVDIIIKQYPQIPPEDTEQRAETIVRDITKATPDILGFSCYVWNMDAVNFISDRLKGELEDVVIVFGGPEIGHQDIEAGKLDHVKADFLVHGEGEKPLQALLESLLGIGNRPLEHVKGLAFRKGNSFVCNSEVDIIDHLDELPSPFLGGYISDETFSMPNARINIETQRGCSFKCAYCLYHKNFPMIRYRKTDTVVKEIEYAYTKGVKDCRIVDANFLSNKEFAKQIMRSLIKRKIEMALFVEMLPQFLDEETAHLFGEYRRISSANRVMVGIGIQTLTQEALVVIRRKIPIRFFENAFNLLLEQNIIVKSDIILGLPRETKESYFETIEFIADKMRYGTNYFSLSVLRILPGTDLVDIAWKENLVIDTRDNSHFVYESHTMPRNDMIECQRLNAAAFRLLSVTDVEERKRIRDLYFEVKDTLGVTNIKLLLYFAREFFVLLKNKGVDYVKPDFPRPETYTSKYAYDQIPDEWLVKQLEFLRTFGLPNI